MKGRKKYCKDMKLKLVGEITEKIGKENKKNQVITIRTSTKADKKKNCNR